MDNNLREQLAAREHEQWSEWMAYFFSKCTHYPGGGLLVPEGYVVALSRLILTPYTNLTEAEKELDRVEADKVLALLPATGRFAGIIKLPDLIIESED